MMTMKHQPVRHTTQKEDTFQKTKKKQKEKTSTKFSISTTIINKIIIIDIRTIVMIAIYQISPLNRSRLLRARQRMAIKEDFL